MENRPIWQHCWRNTRLIHHAEQLCWCASPRRRCGRWLAHWWVLGYNMFKIRLLGYVQLFKNISLGDQGYSLNPWLMTPLTNRAHARTRSTVERAIGLLKGRWLCLSDTAVSAWKGVQDHHSLLCNTQFSHQTGGPSAGTPQTRRPYAWRSAPTTS